LTVFNLLSLGLTNGYVCENNSMIFFKNSLVFLCKEIVKLSHCNPVCVINQMFVWVTRGGESCPGPSRRITISHPRVASVSDGSSPTDYPDCLQRNTIREISISAHRRFPRAASRRATLHSALWVDLWAMVSRFNLWKP
jgi:hypothetical protein